MKIFSSAELAFHKECLAKPFRFLHISRMAMILAFLLSFVFCAASDPNLGLTHKGRHLTVPRMATEKRFTSSTIVEHKELVDFSGVLVRLAGTCLP